MTTLDQTKYPKEIQLNLKNYTGWSCNQKIIGNQK